MSNLGYTTVTQIVRPDGDIELQHQKTILTDLHQIKRLVVEQAKMVFDRLAPDQANSYRQQLETKQTSDKEAFILDNGCRVVVQYISIQLPRTGLIASDYEWYYYT